jgi:hypothetical protein
VSSPSLFGHRFTLPLQADPDSLRSFFRDAAPFPHIVIDRLFPDEALERVLAVFPSPGAEEWRRFDNSQEKKLGSLPGLPEADPTIAGLLAALNEPPMLAFLERLTGIDGLIPIRISEAGACIRSSAAVSSRCTPTSTGIPS